MDFSGEMEIDRREYGMRSYQLIVGNKVKIRLNARMVPPVQELIQSVERGLYCKTMGGGSVGPTGQFNFAVEEGYLIENGALTKPVKGATLIGEAKEVMPRISMCANDLDLAAGFCGSVSGSVFVTVGQPHIKVDSITVGGR